MKTLREAVVADPLAARILAGISGSGTEIYLVGGYVRDLLRGARSKDIDFVVRDDLGRVISRIFPKGEGSVIEFRETLLVRVVIDDTTIDFSELKGGIEEDLARRDFTINAVAWSPEKGIIDPLGGVSDIGKGIIRAVSEKNFVDDPLRLLRAYRLAAELGWIIDKGTRRLMRKLRRSLKDSASERTTLEMFKLLNSDRCLEAVKQAFSDGLLAEVIYLNSKRLADNIKAVSRLNSFLKKIPEDRRYGLEKNFSQGLSLAGLFRAEQLLYGANLGRSHLSLSRAVTKRLNDTAELLGKYRRDRKLNDSQIFDLFEVSEDAAIDLAMLTGSMRLLKKADKFLSVPPVLASREVMRITGLQSGPELGIVLREMKKLRFLGKIRDQNDATRWLRRWYVRT